MSKSSAVAKKTSRLSALQDPTRIRTAWQSFQKLPLGKALFSKIMGWIIPYTGTISPSIQKIEPGFAEVQLRDRRKIRNHLRSVHALALANVGEFCCGLALFSRAPAKAQAILVELNCSYLKKARGLLTATSRFDVTEFQTDTNYLLTAEVRDAAHEVVAVVKTTWRIRI